MKVVGVVLAAGASTRLGQPKQQTRLGSETLLERAVRAAAGAGLEAVIIVLRPGESPEASAAFTGPVRVVTNQHAAEGMASSIRVGVTAAVEMGADAVVILACDQPAVTVQHLCALVKSGAECGDTVASSYAGRKGVPAYFPCAMFSQLLSLRGDRGARDLVKDARTLPLIGGELDIDTFEDLARARDVYDQRSRGDRSILRCRLR